MTHTLQSIGLICDATGIAVLGIPAVFRMVDEIAAQSGTYWDANLHLAKALSTARVDTTVGSVLLLAGFLLQIASHYGLVAAPLVSAIILIALGVFLVLYWCYLRRYLSTALTNLVKRQLKREELASAVSD